MPKLDDDTASRPITGTSYSYQATRIEDLGATEYTLFTVAVDVTSSVAGFETQLRQMLVTAVESCGKSPRSDNLLVRVITFATGLPGGIEEIHGFKPLDHIDTASYPALHPRGATTLTDATDNAVAATIDYAHDLATNDFLVNGIIVVITDGDDNASRATPAMVKKRLEDIRRTEELESLATILVGVNASYYQTVLSTFQTDCGFDSYIDAGNVTTARLAKLAQFVSQSVSSQSQALGTGGPSQAIAATI